VSARGIRKADVVTIAWLPGALSMPVGAYRNRDKSLVVCVGRDEMAGLNRVQRKQAIRDALELVRHKDASEESWAGPAQKRGVR
jgi:hypothetical protein